MGRISMPQGKGSQLHNRRKYEEIGKEVPEHINTKLTSQNITLVDLNIRQAYQSIFGKAVAEYNNKQRRSDRKIEDYYSYIQKSKNGEKLFYEDILQWGKKEDFQSEETREKAKRALIEYVNTFEQRNPNLKLIGAYIHMDEASPHLHLDYVPVAHGYKRGLSARNSLDRAMKEMGFIPEKESRQNNATKMWKENERSYFGDICRNMGLSVEAERKARGSLSVEEYKAAKDEMLKGIEKEYAKKEQAIAEIDRITSYMALQGNEAVKAENMTIEPKKSFWGKTESLERKGVFIENMDEQQIHTLMGRVKFSDKLLDESAYTEKYCEMIKRSAKMEAEKIRSEATADRNKVIAKAEGILRQKEEIIAAAERWAKSLQAKYDELSEKVMSLLKMERRLQGEVAELQDKRMELEPIKQEVEEMKKAKSILSGELSYEFTRSKFRSWRSMPFGSSYDTYREKGELLALYKDGTIRKVGSNKQGGFDEKTLNDEKAGLCVVGIMQEEEKVQMPKRLLNELLQKTDNAVGLSEDLGAFIQQQKEVSKISGKETHLRLR